MPLFFILPILLFLLFTFYIKTHNFSIYLIIIFLISLPTPSIIYNYKNNP
ncbi:hypothetical protein [Staphylococcus aureus]|nr:hypothetical protein [Staphylococcus aureus]